MPGRSSPNPEKIKIVEETVNLINNYPVVGLIDLHKLPAAALQNIKWKLRGKAEIKVVRKQLLKFALEKSKKSLLEKVDGQPALLLTKENPFKIYSFIQKNKSPVSAKVGDIAEDEIVVPAGPTDLMPGPAMTTLSSLKIRSKVEGGKISIMQDVTVAKPGDIINEKLAPVLSLLKMKPIKVALNVTYVLEDGTIYPSKLLYIDDAKIMLDIQTAVQEAFNLSIEAAIVTPDNIEFLLQKSFREAKTICIEANILEKDFIDEVLAKAVREARELEKLVPEAPKEVGDTSKDDVQQPLNSLSSAAGHDASKGEPKADEKPEDKKSPASADTDASAASKEEKKDEQSPASTDTPASKASAEEKKGEPSEKEAQEKPASSDTNTQEKPTEPNQDSEKKEGK